MNSTGEETTRKKKNPNKQLEAAFNDYNVLLFPNLLWGFAFAGGVDTCQFAGAGKAVEAISHLFSSHTQPKKHHKYAKNHRPPPGNGWITIALIFHLFIWFAVMKELLEQHLKQVKCSKMKLEGKIHLWEANLLLFDLVLVWVVWVHTLCSGISTTVSWTGLWL